MSKGQGQAELIGKCFIVLILLVHIRLQIILTQFHIVISYVDYRVTLYFLCHLDEIPTQAFFI